MSAITIQAITILENKEDDTLMAKEEFFKKWENAYKQTITLND